MGFEKLCQGELPARAVRKERKEVSIIITAPSGSVFATGNRRDAVRNWITFNATLITLERGGATI